MTKTFYKVLIGGSAYKEYSSKEEAIEAAVAASVGKEADDFTPIYKVIHTVEYAEKCGKEVVVKNYITETLSIMVCGRKSLAGTGGWVDYE